MPTEAQIEAATNAYLECNVLTLQEAMRAALTAAEAVEVSGTVPEPFVVKHYGDDPRPTIKGNGFDGLVIGDDREEAEDFIGWVNSRIALARRGAGQAAPDEAAIRADERERCRQEIFPDGAQHMPALKYTSEWYTEITKDWLDKE